MRRAREGARARIFGARMNGARRRIQMPAPGESWPRALSPARQQPEERLARGGARGRQHRQIANYRGWARAPDDRNDAPRVYSGAHAPAFRWLRVRAVEKVGPGSRGRAEYPMGRGFPLNCAAAVGRFSAARRGCVGEGEASLGALVFKVRVILRTYLI